MAKQTTCGLTGTSSLGLTREIGGSQSRGLLWGWPLQGVLEFYDMQIYLLHAFLYKFL